ncbi:hypothetical protein N8198_06620 [Gammaproteobacteria bacterium]|nr:hypothetical protein [Gammaproteobacteria bacterium]
MRIRTSLLIALLIMSSPAAAWIAYGFKSGMSRFEVTGHLSDKSALVITEGAQQTFAGPDDNKTKYTLVYCSSPQILYLMKFRLADSRSEFVKTKQKYKKRYGKPEGLDDWGSANWEDADVSLIWDLNESETILLTHDSNGTSAEFQDLSVCH